MGSTAPAYALRKFEECRLLARLNWAWTFEELRRQKAGDVAFLREYLVMTAPRVEESGAPGE